MDGFLVKPVSAVSLRETLERLAGEKRVLKPA
jgi:hypothetical protein